MLNNQLESGELVNTHRIQMVMLAILHVSAWACLIRSDYNFVFIFFAYFYIVSRKDNVSISIIFYIVVLLLLMDLMFFLFVPSSWMSADSNNTVWNNLRPMHGFAIFLSVIIALFKFPLAWWLYNLKKSLGSPK